MNIIIETFGSITMVLAIAGVVLNNRMDRRCFWFWIVSNAISCGLHIYTGLWSLAIRDAAFLILAFDGLRRWRGNKAMRYLLDVQKSRNAAEFEKEFLGIPMPKVEPPAKEYKETFFECPQCHHLFTLDQLDALGSRSGCCPDCGREDLIEHVIRYIASPPMNFTDKELEDVKNNFEQRHVGTIFEPRKRMI